MEVFHFGPILGKSKIKDEDFLKELYDDVKTLGSDAKEFSNAKVEYQRNFDRPQMFKFSKNIIPIINEYVDCIMKNNNNTFPPLYSLKLERMWANIQKEKEYIPPHIHMGHISFVIYLDISKEIYDEPYNNISEQPGSITFQFGNTNLIREYDKENIYNFIVEPKTNWNFMPKVGDIFIFPSYLTHYVESFNTKDAIRAVVAGNFSLKKEDKTNKSIL